jgi:hypothetical protein
MLGLERRPLAKPIVTEVDLERVGDLRSEVPVGLSGMAVAGGPWLGDPFLRFRIPINGLVAGALQLS